MSDCSDGLVPPRPAAMDAYPDRVRDDLRGVKGCPVARDHRHVTIRRRPDRVDDRLNRIGNRLNLSEAAR